jgi:hypothetical protein
MLAQILSDPVTYHVKAFDRHVLEALASYQAARRYPKGWGPAREWSGLPQKAGARPKPFTAHSDKAPPSLQEYLATLSRYNRLRYFAQPSKTPSKCVSIMVSGLAHTSIRIMLDDGANCNLMDEATRLALGIALHPTNIRLTTSNGSGTPVLGITPPLLVVYGSGCDEAIEVWHYFLVTKDMGHVYGILLGNLDTQRFGGIINAADNTLALHTEYERLGTQSPKLVLPTVLQSAGIRN